MTAKRGTNLSQYPVNLGLGAAATTQPQFDGDMSWYAEYGERVAPDGAEARLVSMHTFTTPWDVWEMHPAGSEVVICTNGEITLIQESETGEQTRVRLSQGEYAINEPGVWHTADILEPATAVFITAGLGTEHRPR